MGGVPGQCVLIWSGEQSTRSVCVSMWVGRWSTRSVCVDVGRWVEYQVSVCWCGWVGGVPDY